MNAAHTPTPRTDTAQQWAHNAHPWDEVVSATLSRQLERELAEARESEASEARWAAQYKQQRDALADALRALKELGPPSKSNNIIAASLATLEGGESNPAQKSPPTTP